jgi:hypothetical protein
MLFTSDSVIKNGNVVKLTDHYEQVNLQKKQADLLCNHAALMSEVADQCKDYE